MTEKKDPSSPLRRTWEEEKEWWRLEYEKLGRSSPLVEEDSADDTIEVTFLKRSEKNSPEPSSQDHDATS